MKISTIARPPFPLHLGLLTSPYFDGAGNHSFL